jgi:beta-lactamase class A
MKLIRTILPAILFINAAVLCSTAQTQKQVPEIRSDSRLQAIVDDAVKSALNEFSSKGLKPDQIAVTLIDLRDGEAPARASYRGDSRIYPASVVKLFYLAAVHRWLEDGKLKDTQELRRAMKDMVVDSSNDATHYIVDALTGTSSGTELSPAQLKSWAWKRNAVNRYFASLGYTNINVNQKTFCEDAYGREMAFRGPKGENRNKLNTDATARLLSEIVTGKAVSPERSGQMMELLKRDFSGTSKNEDDQAHGFTGIALSPGMRLWSKAGWTSTTRHDAAYVEMGGGKRFILVTFTTDHANDREIIPTVARAVIGRMQDVNGRRVE